MKYVGLYIPDEEEEILEKIKEICREKGISISRLIRGFFRAIVEQTRDIIINNVSAIQIGAIQIAFVQQQQTINIVSIKTQLIEAIEYLKKASRIQHIQKKTSFERAALEILQKIVKKL